MAESTSRVGVERGSRGWVLFAFRPFLSVISSRRLLHASVFFISEMGARNRSLFLKAAERLNHREACRVWTDAWCRTPAQSLAIVNDDVDVKDK